VHQQYKLQNWWKPKKYDVIYNSFYELVSCIENADELEATHRIYSLPLLTIGQMMELLNDLGYNTEFLRWQDMDCDNLFEIVKQVLGEEDGT